MLSPRLTRHAHSRRIECLVAERDGGVETVVGVAQHAPEQPVDLIGLDGRQREPADDVDVAELIDGERDPVHVGVTREQPGMHGGRVVLGLAHEEGLDQQAEVLHHEPGHRGELVLTGKGDQERAVRRMLVLELQIDQRLLDHAVKAQAFLGRQRARHGVTPLSCCGRRL